MYVDWVLLHESVIETKNIVNMSQSHKIPGNVFKKGLVAKWTKNGAAFPEGTPFLTTTNKPCNTPNIPSVITSGGIFINVTPIPLINPIKAPTNKVTTTAGNIAALLPSITLPATTAAIDTTPPTDRSLPSLPPRITKFCPAEIIPKSDATINKLIIWLGDAKPGEIKLPKKNKIIINVRATVIGLNKFSFLSNIFII